MATQHAHKRTRTNSSEATIKRLVELKGDALLSEIEQGANTKLLETCAAMYAYSTAALLAILNIPKSTITSRKTKTLNENEFNKLVRYVKLMHFAERVLGTKDAAIRWMYTNQPSLGGRKPNALLGSELGRGEVENTLLAIEYGVYL